MDNLNEPTVINEDEIIFEFGDERFEPTALESQSQQPPISEKADVAPNSFMWLNNYKASDIGLENYKRESHDKFVDTQEDAKKIVNASSIIVEQSDPSGLHPKLQVHDNDVNSPIFHHPANGSAVPTNGSNFEVDLNDKTHDTTEVPDKILSGGDGYQNISILFSGNDLLQESHVSSFMGSVQGHALSVIDDNSDPSHFAESNVHEESTLSFSQLHDDCLFSDNFNLTDSSFIVSESNQENLGGFPIASSEITIDLSGSQEHAEKDLPMPFAASKDPLLPPQKSLVADDEFDFDELVASRTHMKSVLQQEDTQQLHDHSVAAVSPEVAPVQEQAEALKHATDEWDQVETIEAGVDVVPGTQKMQPEIEAITVGEALSEMDRRQHMQQYGTLIKTSVTRSLLATLFHRLCGGPRLQQRLCIERDFAFCLAACPFKNEEEIHFRVLASIYRQLTGSRFNCPRFGSHWELIGFQGNDPATDLRGAGILSLVQLLHLVTEPKTESLAKCIYRLSLHETQNFPFCVMGINLTRMVMSAMREDHLNKECNRRGQVLGVLNDFYVGLFQRLYTVWKTQHKTIRDTGFVLADLETFAKKHPQQVVRMKLDTEPTNPANYQYDLPGGIAHIDTNVF